MGHAPPRRVVLAHGLLALLVVLTGTACSGGPKAITPPAPAPSISAVPTDPEVAATGLPDNVDVEVTDSSPGTESGDNLDFVSPVYTVKPLGPLDQAATFTLRLDNALPVNTPVVVVTRQWNGDGWTYQRGRITDDQRHVEFRTTELDQVGVLAIDREGAVSSFRSDVRSGLLPEQVTKAAKPTCEKSASARELGYAVNATENKTLFWCFGLEKEKRVVTITNRRVVPVEVAHTGMDVVSEPRTPRAYAVWRTVLGTRHTILAPGRTATYDAELQPEARVTLVAASTARAQSLRVLQAASRAFVKRLNAFGAGPVRPAPTLATLLESARCAGALKVSVDALVKRCFTMAQLTKVFGSRALLLEPLISGPYPPVFFGKLGKRLTTEARSQRERVFVHRAAPDFSGLVGLWAGHTRLLSVNAQGVVGERLDDGSGALVVSLTYQLEGPVTKAGTTTADATITTVKVGKRKLLKGRVPRVGDTGKITLRKGVITPPFLKTNYCDSKANKSGTCD